MAQEKKKAKLNIPMCLALILLCLTMFTTHLMSGLYARYVTKGSGEDSARVASMGNVYIEEKGDIVDNKLLVIPGVNLEKDAELTYTGSEVACYVFVEIDTTKFVTSDKKVFTAFESKISWEVGTDWEYLTSNGSKHVYYQYVGPNDKLTKVDLIKDGNIIVSENLGKSELSEMKDYKIGFHAYAMQYDGSSNLIATEHVMAAWNSVKVK